MAERESGTVTTKEMPKLTAKGLYSIGTLASVLSDLQWVQQSAEWEAEWEEDGSAVPAMLAEAMRQLGAALIAMTEEEVAEALAALAEEEGEGTEADKSAPAITVKDIVGALHGKAIAGMTTGGRITARTATASIANQTADTDAAKAARIREAEALRLALA
jgi:hypothetical protein